MDFSSGGVHSPATPHHHRRKFRNPIVSRRRRHNKAPPTPHLQWKTTACGVEVSARKLAAGLWKLHLAAEISGSGFKCESCEPGFRHANIKFPHHRTSKEYGVKMKDLSCSPRSGSGQKNKILYKLKSSLPHPKSTKDGATKWDPNCSKTSNEAYCLYHHMKFSVVSALQAELVRAQLRILELGTEKRSSKKKVEDLLRKLGEERTLWQTREHQKICAVVDALKDELSREKKNCQRMEILNTKLVNDLANVKLLVKKFMQDYEEQKQARELMEAVCDELAKKIGEDKAEFEALKRESIKFCEEVEEERKMLQIAELWREERVQMKLVDAKLALENRFCQMNKLINDLETFLMSRSATLDVMELRKAELIWQAVKSVNIQDMKEFAYEPTKSGDIFSIFEELWQGEAYEREIEHCVNFSPAGNTSKIHTASLEANDFTYNPVLKHSNGFIDYSSDLEEDARGSETVIHAEDQGSSYCLEGSSPSVNRVSQGKNALRSGTEWNKNAGHDSSNTQITEVCSVSAEQPKQKAFPVSKLWRSCPSTDDFHKTMSDDQGDRRLSNGTVSTLGTASPSRKSCEASFKHRNSVWQLSLPDSANPHITRGMNGHIEWPRGIQKNTLKAKLLEARMESHKAQLRNVLKQKS